MLICSWTAYQIGWIHHIKKYDIAKWFWILFLFWRWTLIMSNRHYFIGLCIVVRTCKFIPLEFIKFNLYYVPTHMFMWAMYCVCRHTFHSTHICVVFNSVKCVHYFYLQVNSWIITYLSHCLNLQPILCIVHWTHWILDFKYILLLLLSCVPPLFWSLCVCCMWVWGRESVTVLPERCSRGECMLFCLGGEWGCLSVFMHVFPAGTTGYPLLLCRCVLMLWWCHPCRSRVSLVYVVLECQVCICWKVWAIGRHAVEHQFRIGVMLMFASECGVCLMASDVVWDEFDNGVRDACPVQPMCECVHVEHTAHIQCDCAFRWSVSVEPMLCSAVLADWLHLKPCCVETCGMLPVMYGSSVFSSVFAITERSEMGLYDVPMFKSLFGLGTGMMSASFHACCCPVICRTTWWDMRVQAVLCAWGAWCWLYQATWSCCFCFVLLSLGLVLWWVLTRPSAVRVPSHPCVYLCRVFHAWLRWRIVCWMRPPSMRVRWMFSPWKLLCCLCCACFLVANPCMVFQRIYVLCLWSQCVSRCSLHTSDLCVCMGDVISEFNNCVLCSDAVSVLYPVSHVHRKQFACGVHLSSRDVAPICVENDVCEDGVCSVHIRLWLNVRES